LTSTLFFILMYPPCAIASCVLLPLGRPVFMRAPVSAARLIGRNGRRHSLLDLEPAAASCPVHAVRVCAPGSINEECRHGRTLLFHSFLVIRMSSTDFLRVSFPCTSSVLASEHSCVRTKKRYSAWPSLIKIVLENPFRWQA
jgi:hypothetical protein